MASASDTEVIPAALAALRPGTWCRVGQAVVQWTVFDLYDVSYWVCGPRGYPRGNFAILADYRRTLAAMVLYEATLEELHRTGSGSMAADPERRAWLMTALPDVVRGDQLMVVVLDGKYLSVHHNGVRLAQRDDAELAAAFAAIWLGPRSRVPQLTAADSRLG